MPNRNDLASIDDLSNALKDHLEDKLFETASGDVPQRVEMVTVYEPGNLIVTLDNGQQFRLRVAAIAGGA